MTDQEVYNKNKELFYIATKGLKLIESVVDAMTQDGESLLLTATKQLDISSIEMSLSEQDPVIRHRFKIEGDHVWVDGEPKLYMFQLMPCNTDYHIKRLEGTRFRNGIVILNCDNIERPERIICKKFINLNE